MCVACANLRIPNSARKDYSIARKRVFNSRAAGSDDEHLAKTPSTNKRQADSDEVSLRTPAKKVPKTEQKTPSKQGSADEDIADYSPATRKIFGTLERVFERHGEKAELDRLNYQLAKEREQREAEAARRQAREAKWRLALDMINSSNPRGREAGERMMAKLLEEEEAENGAVDAANK